MRQKFRCIRDKSAIVVNRKLKVGGLPSRGIELLYEEVILLIIYVEVADGFCLAKEIQSVSSNATTRIHGASAHPTYPPNNGYGRVIGEIDK